MVLQPFLREIPQINGIYPDIHSKKISNFFGLDNIADESSLNLLKKVSIQKKILFLCFTNRCGSNHIAEAIASSNSMNIPGEKLNYNVVISHSKREGLNSYAEYLTWLITNTSDSTNVFGVKCSASQLIYLFNNGIIESLNDVRFLHVRRHNIFKQAISRSIAVQTGQWTSKQDKDENSVLNFNSEDLVKFAIAISQQNSLFETLFKLWGANYIQVFHEDFLKNKVDHISDIGKFLDVHDMKYIEDKISLKKQGNSLNDRIYNSFISQFKIQ